jgi:FkbM family methyltransferase
LSARISSYGDWLIYNEIFVAREYDRALAIALDFAARENSPIHIVDFGANVGFFTMRAVQELRRAEMAGRDFTITAVEANAGCAEDFRTRIFGENGLSDSVTLAQGLIGERSGTAPFYENSLFQHGGYRRVDLSYIDLSALLAATPRIDLLKCDIEGAELLLLENYPDLFHKTRVAIFEFHPYLCDVERCRRLLEEYGLTRQEMFRTSRDTSIYAVWREPETSGR